MKIGMMGGWNTNSGASLHAELVGRSWVAAKHDLKVFTFYDYAFHGTAITGKDESYVSRCFTVSSYATQKLDPVPFLTSEYDIFVAQDLGMLAKDELGKIFHKIKKHAKTVNVIHDGNLSTNPSFYQFDWDAIVCFDERYRKFLATAYDKDKIHIIPYPCLPWNPGDKSKARKKLGLPMDKKIIFSFGPASRHVIDLIPDIAALRTKYPIMLLIVTKEKDIINTLKRFSSIIPIPLQIIEEIPEVDKLYDYLYAADALVFNKPTPPQVVVSSTAFQCLGSGCPMVAKNASFVEYFDKEVMKFSNPEELKKHLSSVFDENNECKATIKAAKEYVTKNSTKAIGESFIKLFKSLV